jgi:hypothetical protein
MLTTHVHLVPKSRMTGAMSLLLHPSWHVKGQLNLSLVIAYSSPVFRVTDLAGEYIIIAGFMVDLFSVSFISQINDNVACYSVRVCRSQRHSGLRRGYAASCWLELRARIPP